MTRPMTTLPKDGRRAFVAKPPGAALASPPYGDDPSRIKIERTAHMSARVVFCGSKFTNSTLFENNRITNTLVAFMNLSEIAAWP